MQSDDVILPTTQPETEFVLGRTVQKASPSRAHGRLQQRLCQALETWAAGRGQAAVEWRFRIAPPGERRRPLVPDVAYVAADRLRGLSFEDAEYPTFAPDIAVEIRSRDDRDEDIADKVVTFLAAGTRLVILVDPTTRTVTLVDHERECGLRDGDSIEPTELPGFALPLTELFAVLALPR